MGGGVGVAPCGGSHKQLMRGGQDLCGEIS